MAKISLQPDQKSRNHLWRVAGTLISVALVIYLIGSQGWDEFVSSLRRLPPHTFWIALGLVLGSRICVVLRWYTLLRSAGLKMSLKDCTRLVFMGLFASNFLPSTVGGDLVRMAGALQLGLGAGASAASLVTDRLVGMAGMATLLPIGLAAVLKTGGLPGLSLAVIWQKIPLWLREKAARFGRGLWQGLASSVRNPAGLLWALLCTYGHMFFTFAVIWLIVEGLDQPISFWVIGGLWSFSYFVSLLPVSINGLGLQELSITYLYTQFGGLSMQTGLALAVLLRILFMLGSLPGVVFLPDIVRPLRGLGGTASDKH